MPTIQTTEAARALGSVKTARKAASSRANLAKARKKIADALAAFRQDPPWDEKREQAAAEKAAPLTYRSRPVSVLINVPKKG
jgi:hypothetical protein